MSKTSSMKLQTSPKFWMMIEKRRKQKTIPLEEMKKRLNIRK